MSFPVPQLSGLVAKGNVELVYKSCGPEVLATLRTMALQGLVDPDNVIRKTANNIVSTLARQSQALKSWKDLFPALTSLMQNPNEL